jgi:hypothetical protein
MSASRDKMRDFWATVLAKASTNEIAQMIDTLEARDPCEGSEADNDLLALARRTLHHRRGVGAPSEVR